LPTEEDEEEVEEEEVEEEVLLWFNKIKKAKIRHYQNFHFLIRVVNKCDHYQKRRHLGFGLTN
jgi:hypothetical protein